VTRTDTAAGADRLQLSGFKWSETFIRPTAFFGALLQFVSTTRTWGVSTTEFELADVLAGRIVWRDYPACLRDLRKR